MFFAVDTSFLFKMKRQIVQYEEVYNAISKVVHWFNVNYLHLNANTVPNVDTNVHLNGINGSGGHYYIFKDYTW